MRFRDARVVVTGGGSGIGRAVAVGFAQEGAKVAICGRRESLLEETATLAEGPEKILYRAADIADSASVNAFFDWARRAIGEPTILVNSAGVNVRRRSMAELDPSDWQRLLQINATGAYLAIRAVLPAMRSKRSGVIVNISSVAGKRAAELGGVAYNASKFAMTALGTSVALEERHHGIRVTNIYPGEVDTPILTERPTPVSDEHRAKILQPEDVAAAVLFVCSLPERAHVPELVIKPTIQAYA